MPHSFYQFTPLSDSLRFDFVSIGVRTLRKVVLYQKLPIPNLYNLALGDIDEHGQPDFKVTSENGDRDIVLATVVQTLTAFFEKYPQASVTFTGGSSLTRTRLYQVAIAHELEQAQERFAIYGLVGEELEFFERNKSYQGFVISPKQS